MFPRPEREQEIKMPYVYAKVDKIELTEKVGSHQCVALVQHYANAPGTLGWKKGADVLGNHGLTKGTAIATFVDGKYKSHAHGNHAALYLGQGPNGIWVMDQWNNDRKPKVSKRFIQNRSLIIGCKENILIQ